jgi:hypothetical protein
MISTFTSQDTSQDNIKKSNTELTPDKLNELTKQTVNNASVIFTPEDSDETKKVWCAKRLTQILETFDNFVPVVGIFLDNPIADGVEEDAIHLLVDWGWDRFKDDDLSETPITPMPATPPPTPPKETDPFSQSDYDI